LYIFLLFYFFIWLIVVSLSSQWMQFPIIIWSLDKLDLSVPTGYSKSGLTFDYSSDFWQNWENHSSSVVQKMLTWDMSLSVSTLDIYIFWAPDHQINCFRCFNFWPFVFYNINNGISWIVKRKFAKKIQINLTVSQKKI
jgi:hypothetical protein